MVTSTVISSIARKLFLLMLLPISAIAKDQTAEIYLRILDIKSSSGNFVARVFLINNSDNKIFSLRDPLYQIWRGTSGQKFLGSIINRMADVSPESVVTIYPGTFMVYSIRLNGDYGDGAKVALRYALEQKELWPFASPGHITNYIDLPYGTAGGTAGGAAAAGEESGSPSSK